LSTSCKKEIFSRGHKVEAYIPRKLNEHLVVTDRDLLEKYKDEGIVKECPAKSYDDRFVIQSAIHHDGLIISNDQYRDLIQQNPEYREKLK
jgi:ribonuclease ZC3H12